MLRDLRKAVATGLLVILPATMAVPGAALAKQNGKLNGKGKAAQTEHANKNKQQKKFKDMEKHWANKDVTKLNEQDIISGYEDGTFKPEKEVTTLEAVVMAVRALGLTDEANEQMSESLPFKDAPAIPAWARGYVAVALDEDLIDAEKVFQPYKPATRMDATILLVRALHNQTDLDTIDEQLEFVDTLELNREFKQYIAQAVNHNLITGYKDKTFRPNKHVTRAEMAALFARFLENSPIEDRQTRLVGVVTEIDLHDSVIKVKTTVSDPTYGKTRTLEVLSSAEIYRNNAKADLEDLKLQDKVELVLNEHNQVISIDANATDEEVVQELFRSRITDIDTDDNTIAVTVNNVVREFEVRSGADIYRNDVEVDLEDLKVEDRVNILVNEHDQIIYLHAHTTEVEMQTLINGHITDIDVDAETISVKSSKVSRKLTVLSSADIYRNGSRVDLEDLRDEDDVYLILDEHNRVVFIVAKAGNDEDNVQQVIRGKVLRVNPNDETITVNLSSNIEVRYALADDAEIIRDGRNVSLSRLEVNDKVVLLQNDDGLITKITATND